MREQHGATALVDTDDGVRIVRPHLILRPRGGMRRLLMTRSDLVEDAEAAELTLSEFLRANAASIDTDLNAVLDNETQPVSSSTPPARAEPGHA
ncbi:hypothetical protein GCM10018962_75330 [Dactylosporangium matsuzakiense]|uniref:Uncharacterized protein n=1 Tax=Dactylosporangium matsuzakiense TaxID=53360 RepID=A0A9W6KUW4_9ACTN|nr:hypothetical protein GCM10017581_094110 [Dactylosporangium matsuzakiense]